MSALTDRIGFFRTRWADELADSCIVKRQTGSSFDSGTGQTTPSYTTQYSGACLVRPVLREEGRSADFGGQQTEYRRYSVFVPYDTDGLQPDDLVDVTSTRDGDLDGKQLVVRNVRTDTYNVVRELNCEDNQGG